TPYAYENYSFCLLPPSSLPIVFLAVNIAAGLHLRTVDEFAFAGCNAAIGHSHFFVMANLSLLCPQHCHFVAGKLSGMHTMLYSLVLVVLFVRNFFTMMGMRIGCMYDHHHCYACQYHCYLPHNLFVFVSA